MSFEKAQKRKKRKIKKRDNTERAAKAELNHKMALQRQLLAILVMQDEIIFAPERYWDLLHELSGETEWEPIKYDDTAYWVVVAELKKMPDSWVINLDSKGRKWELRLDYVLRVRRQVANGEIPTVSLWLEAEAAEAAAAGTETGKVLGDADHELRGDSGPIAEGGTLHGDEP